MIGEQIAQARAGRKESLRAAAKALGVTGAYIHDIEHGRRSLPLKRVPSFCRHFGLDEERVMAEVLRRYLPPGYEVVKR